MFVLGKIAGFLIAPTNVAGTAAAVALLAAILGLRRTVRAAAGLALGILIVFAVVPTGPYLVHWLERQYPAASHDAPAAVDGIIVLGGGVDAEATLESQRPATSAAASRLFAFAGLADRYPRARLVFTGGSGSLVSDAREADAVEEILASVGIAPDRVEFERDSRTTAENARMAFDMVEPDPEQVWLLVTSAYHMRRAVTAFEAAGWRIRPYPVGFQTPADRPLPPGYSMFRNLKMAEIAIHELAGYGYYRARASLADDPS